MGWDVGESSGEDGVFGWAERWGRFVLVGMVGAATLPDEGEGSEICWVPGQDCVRWPHGSHLATNLGQVQVLGFLYKVTLPYLSCVAYDLRICRETLETSEWNPKANPI